MLLKPFPPSSGFLGSPQAYDQEFFINSNGKKSSSQGRLQTWLKGRTRSTPAQGEAGDETITSVKLHSARCMQQLESTYKKPPKIHLPALPPGWNTEKLWPTSQLQDSSCHSTINSKLALCSFQEIRLKMLYPSLSTKTPSVLPNTTAIYYLPSNTLKSTGPKGAILLIILRK